MVMRIREKKSLGIARHHHRLSPRAASFLCGAAHVPLPLPPSPSLLSAAAVAVRPPFMGGEEEEEEGAAWCLFVAANILASRL